MPISLARRFALLGGFSLAVALAGAAHAAPAATLETILAGPQRTDAERARDVYRHPLQTLRFFGLQPGQTVIEIEPGGGWYTEILAPYLRDRGTLYEAPYFRSATAAESASNLRFKAKLAQDPADYDHVRVGALRAGQFSGVGAAGTADMVLTFRNVHNWIEDGHLDDNFRAFYAALKPGGVLGVVDHRARPGTSLAQMDLSGYMTEAYVIERARAAGFVVSARSEINANALDTKDYAAGVWALPPTYAGGNADRARYRAIGESDRMTIRFVKPATRPLTHAAAP